MSGPVAFHEGCAGAAPGLMAGADGGVRGPAATAPSGASPCGTLLWGEAGVAPAARAALSSAPAPAPTAGLRLPVLGLLVLGLLSLRGRGVAARGE